MKRLVLVVACLALAAPLVAEKTRRVPRQAHAGAPATVTIASAPLSIVVGNDPSLQVDSSNVVNVPTGVSFTGNAGPAAVVPTLSNQGLAALVLLLAAVGYVLVRRTSLGA